MAFISADTIRQSDRYYNATEMCKANGVRWHNYWKNDKAKAFARLVAEQARIRACSRDGSLAVVQLGDKARRPTFVHRDVAWHLGTQISDEFYLWLIRQGQAIEDGRQAWGFWQIGFQ